MPSLLIFFNCTEFAGRDAETASYADIRIDNKVGFADDTGNCGNGAAFCAKAAAFAFFCINGIYGEVFANVSGAAFILNVCKIFVIERCKGRDNGVCARIVNEDCQPDNG